MRHGKSLAVARGLGGWASDLLAEAVTDPAGGRLHRELDALASEDPPRILILRNVALAEPWRGYGLGGLLVATVLRTMAPNGRLAACRIRPEGFAQACPDPGDAELASGRFTALLRRLGFREWHGDVHVLSLADPALREAQENVLKSWIRASKATT